LLSAGCWIGNRSRPLASWVTTPAAGAGAAGILIVPAIAYEYWTGYRTLRALAEKCAAAGITALRLDPYATGSSAGDAWESDSLEGWREAIHAGVEKLRALGCEWIALAGLRAGGSLALIEAAEVKADAVIAWQPVESGRRYVRELTLLGTSVPEDDPRPYAAGEITSSGVPLPSGFLDGLRGVSLTSLEISPAPRVLVLRAHDAPPSEKFRGRLDDLGVHVDDVAVDDAASMLGVSCERARVPEESVSAIVAWVAAHAPGGSAAARTASSAEAAESSAVLSWRGGQLVEQMTTIGAGQLHGIFGTPYLGDVGGLDADAAALPTTVVVFLNPGAEHSVGPGRCWVEYSRRLNLSGHATLRLDFRGWGESPTAPPGFGGNPYDPHTIDDVVDVIDSLTDRGFEKVVLVGLCASSWIALRAVLRAPVAGVFALNPEFLWHWGAPFDLSMEEGERWSARDLEACRRGARWGLWSVGDALGLRSKNDLWLNALATSGVALRFVYADDDLGIRHLRLRHARRIRRLQARRTLEIQEIADIDHSMHREWLRPKISASLEQFVQAIAAGTSPDQAAGAPDTASWLIPVSSARP